MLTPTNSHILRAIKGIIFDCDGVMFDTRELNAFYYDKIIQKLGLPPLTEEQQELAFALTAEQLFDRFVGKNREEEIKQICADFPYEKLIPQMKIESGLLQLVQFLHKKNIRCAVNTNRRDSMERILEHFGLAPYFFPVMTCKKTTFAKPHPEGIFKILDIWKLSPKQVLFIGDSAIDMEAARRANTFFASFKNTNLQADIYFQNFSSIQQTLAESQNLI